MKTAESVSPMHPDKICDRISDAILDACLEQDPNSRVAIETMGGHGIITITGELTTEAFVDMREIAQRIAGTQYGVQVNVVRQSPEIAQGVDTGGAGDQGIIEKLNLKRPIYSQTAEYGHFGNGFDWEKTPEGERE